MRKYILLAISIALSVLLLSSAHAEDAPKIKSYTCTQQAGTGPKFCLPATNQSLPENLKSQFIEDCSTVEQLCGKTITNSSGQQVGIICSGIETDQCPNFGAVFQPPPAPLPPVQAQDLGQLISNLFDLSLQILGIAVFVMITYGGFMRLTAGGNPAKIGAANGRISNAVLGAILLLSAYVILNTINPDFVKNSTNLPQLGK